MTNKEKRAHSPLEIISKSVGVIAGVVSIFKTITENDSLVGGFLGTLTYYIGSIVFGIYFMVMLVATLFARLLDDQEEWVEDCGIAISVILGIVLGIYLGDKALHRLDTIGLIFTRIVGVAALSLSIYFIARHFSVDSKSSEP